MLNKKFNQFKELESFNVVYVIPDLKNYSILFFWFPSLKNIQVLFKSLIVNNTKNILYVLHEPFESILTYYKSGFSIVEIIKLALISIVNILICKVSTYIILPSKKAEMLYKKSLAYKINKNTIQIPLMFFDENISKNKIARKYFSYIGTVANDHAFHEFVNFIKESNFNKKNINFLIATRSKLDVVFVEKYLNYSNVKLIFGKPMSNNEINNFYRSSVLVWNAYHRTTQSGVMAKSFMFGTPVICLYENANEFNISNENTIFIKKHTFKEIYNAYELAQTKNISFQIKCRDTFMNKFYYPAYNKKIKSILK